MKVPWLLTVVVSLVLAGVAAMYANKMLNERIDAVQAVEVQLFPVAVATADIPAGTRVQPTQIKMVGVPADAKPEGSYADMNELVGQVAKQSVYAGEIISSNRFATSPGSSALAAIIPEGKRAITVAVNNVVGVSGFILPGSRVDIISAEGGEPRTILQNIKVLAVGQLLNQEKNDPVNVSAVTLEVDPRQAEIIVKARNLRLTLRNPDDGIVVADAEPQKAPAAPEGPKLSDPKPAQQERYVSLYVVDIVRGTNVSSESMDL
jgi:pilus assembly protein CpaB